MKQLISIIIPTYNRPYSYLNRAISSVLEQSYNNIEIIVVDDNQVGNAYSKEIESAITQLEDDRISYYRHKKNLGACAARNTGIEKARGEYVAFLDDDDRWLPNKLEKQLEQFTSGVGLVYCDSYTVEVVNGIEINRSILANRIKGHVFEQLLKENFIGSTSFPLIKKEAINACGDFNTELESAQDYELWLRVAREYEVSYVPLPLVEYYNHDEERISRNPLAKIKGQEKIIELYSEYLNDNKKILALRKAKIIPFYYRQYGYKCAMKKSIEVIKLDPFNKLIYMTILKTTVKKIIGRV